MPGSARARPRGATRPTPAPFWAAHAVLALGLLAATRMALARVAARSALPGIVPVALSAVAASLRLAPPAPGIDALFDAEGSRDEAAMPLPLRAASAFAQFVLPFVLTWVLIEAPSLMKLEAARGARPLRPGPADAPGPSGEAEFRARIPGRLGRDIVALPAALHYPQVCTTRGEALILFPFGRAVEVLRDARGMPVHRSHWVALDHVDALVTRDGRLFCDRVRGPGLPVSRSCRPALRAALRSARGGSARFVQKPGHLVQVPLKSAPCRRSALLQKGGPRPECPFLLQAQATRTISAGPRALKRLMRAARMRIGQARCRSRRTRHRGAIGSGPIARGGHWPRSWP